MCVSNLIPSTDPGQLISIKPLYMGQNIPPQATSSMLLKQHWQSFSLKGRDSGHSEIKSKDIYESRTSHLKPLQAASAVKQVEQK